MCFGEACIFMEVVSHNKKEMFSYCEPTYGITLHKHSKYSIMNMVSLEVTLVFML